MEEVRIISAPDGRHLQFRVSGPEDGPLLVYHHGFPGGAHRMRTFERPAHARGLRVVTIARPGYGDSSRRPGRRVVDVVEDTDTVLDALGASSCLVVGWSGGGPYALACAARLERARAVLVTAGLAPFDAERLDWFAGMGPGNVTGFERALEGENGLASDLEARAPTYRALQADQVETVAQLLPDVDRAVLTDDVVEDMVEMFREGLRTGVDGWVDDVRAMVRPWEFDVGTIAHPVTLWHGTEDRNVPVAHGRWLAAHMSGVQAHLVEGEGHVSVVVRMVGAMLDELVARAPD